MGLVGGTLGQFQIIEEVGTGGMATVYKAYQASLQRYVAIKVLSPTLAEDIDLVKRFLREARSAAALHHPNVIVIHDVGSQDNIHYIVSEYLEGSTLADLLGGRGALDAEQVLHITRQLASALDYAHSLGFIHRDIKPSNVMVDPSRNNHVTLMDFGLVWVAGGSRITQTGLIMGTPDYMSPEQARGDAIDHRTDIYSLGVTLYHMCTGEVPFGRPTPHAVLMAHIMDEPPPMSVSGRGISPEVEAVVRRCLAKRAQDRYEWAGDMASELEVAIRAPASYASLSAVGAGDRAPAAAPTIGSAETPTMPWHTPMPGTAVARQTPPSTAAAGPQTPRPGAPAYAQTPSSGVPRFVQTPPAGVTPYPQSPPSAARPARSGWLWLVLMMGMLAVVVLMIIIGLLLAPALLPRIPAIARLTQAAQTATAIAYVASPTPFTVPQAPIIQSFQAIPGKQVRGEEVELSWQVSGEITRLEITANLQTIPALPQQGRLSVQVDQTTLFVLTAYNGDLSTSASVEVAAVNPTHTSTATSTPLPTDTAAPPTGTPTAETTATSTSTPVPPTATAAPPPVSPTPTTAAPPPTPTPTPAAPTGVLTSFEQWGTWKRGDQPNGELTQTQEQVKSGSYAAKLSYDFPEVGDDFVVFANLVPIVGNPNAITAWVYGDDSGHLMNVWIQDAEGQVWSVHLGSVGGSGWEQMTGMIDAGLPWPSGPVFGPDNGAIDYPIRLYGIVLDRPDTGPLNGQIYIDDLAVEQ